MSLMQEIIEELRKSRSIAMYVGRISILRLADFLRGYEHAIEKLGHGEDHFLADFHDWLAKRFGSKDNKSWERLILERSEDEGDAVRRFWELVDEFQRFRSAQDLPPGDSAMPTPTSAASISHVEAIR